MKTKYLFTALALGALASCTQEDVLTQGSENLVASKERVEVGQVAFTTGVESRFDFGDAERIGWENGEKFGLFLMDEWNTEGNGDWSQKNYHPEQGGHWAYDDSKESGEKTDANKTYYREQKVWNQMYAIRNYFQTNIPFIFDRAKGAWTNDDAVVEGNYFAVAPSKRQQERDNHLGKLTNRRDVWLYINPVQKLGNQKNAIGKENQLRGGIEENQFFLGYKQVYRDQKLTDGNVLQLPLQMQPIMGMVKLGIQNSDEKPFIVDKLVIRRVDGGAMPTIAYVRPDGRETESQTEAPSFAKPFDVEEYYDNCGKLVTDYFYNEATWTRRAARSIVEYSYPRDPKQNGFIPYGMTAEQAEIAYEYTIDFTDENGEGYLLNKLEYFHALFALPHNMNMSEYTYTLYGKQMKGFGNEEFQEGIIVPNATDYVSLQGEESDGQFTLPKVNLAADGMYQTAYIDFDDFRVETATTCRVSSSEELMRYLKMNEDKYAAGTDVWFKVYALGDVEITSELVQYIKTQNAKLTEGQIVVQFIETQNGHLIFGKDLNEKHENAIDVFYYSKAVDIVVEEGAEMTITKPIVFDYTPLEELLKAIRESGPMPNPFIDNDPLNPYYEEDFLNDGVDVISKIEPAILRTLYGGVKSILNYGTLNINANIEFPAICVPSLINEEGATMNIGEVTICGGVTARPDLDGDGEDDKFCNPALPTKVHNDGTLNLSKTTIVGTLENSNITNVKKGQTTIDVIKNNNTCVGCPTGDAVLNIKADGIYNNYDLVCPEVENGAKGVINVEGGAQYGDATAKIGGENKGTINIAEGAEMNVTGENTLVNTGVINVAGHLFDQIANYAEIFVIGNGEVVVNGDLNTVQSLGNVAGIIDITQANDGINAHAAKDMASANKNKKNYFRYDVNDEETAEELDAALKARISEFNYYAAENVEPARIIVRWTNATTATEFVGETESNIQKLYIYKNLDFVYDEDNAVTSFGQLEDVCWAYGIYNGTNEYYPAVVIAENVKVQVANYQTLIFAEGDMYGWQNKADGLVDVDALTVQVNAGAELKVNNFATVSDERVVLQGAGKVINAAANFYWENSGISGITTSNRHGW